MDNQVVVDDVREAYINALEKLNAANEGVLEHERVYNMRVSLNQTLEVFESHYGSDVALKLQLLFLQSLPILLNSRRTISDAVAFVDNVIAPLGIKVLKDTLFSVEGSRVGGLSLASLVVPGQADEGIRGIGMANPRKKRRSLPVTDDREILALFLKNVREGLSLKSLSESVAKDFNENHEAKGENEQTGAKMNKWWYRHFKLEDCDDLGNLMGKYGISDGQLDVMKNYFHAWKVTYESNKAKKGTRGSLAGGVTPETRTDMENSVPDARLDMESSVPVTRTDIENSVPEPSEGVSPNLEDRNDQNVEQRQVLLPMPTASTSLLEAIVNSKSSVSLEGTSEKQMETVDEGKGKKKKKKAEVAVEGEKEGKKKKSHKKRNKKNKKKRTVVASEDEPAIKKQRTEPATSVGGPTNVDVV